MAERLIRVRGARVHNLKNIDCDLPAGELIAISGVSGSGKSSLAFDTLYAEGQRRYLETFSAYTRQFLDRLEKPDVDRIDGMPAAVAVAQLAPKRSSRSTVGSMTEIDDHLAVLFARLGQVFCRGCGEHIEPSSVGSVSQFLASLPERTRYQVGFPIEILEGTSLDLLADSLRENGFMRVRVDQKLHLIESGPIPEPSESREIDVIVDRLVTGSETIERREDSISIAFQRGFGRCRILTDSGQWTFHRDWICPSCGLAHCQPEPGLFRPNSPVGACPSCEGFGRVSDFDLNRVIPNSEKTIREGAVVPYQMPAYQELQEDLIHKGPGFGLRLDTPWKDLTEAERQIVIDGKKSKGLYGIRDFFAWLEKKTYKMHIRVFLARWRSYRPCGVCDGRRLKPESLAVKVHSLNLAELQEKPLEDVFQWLQQVAAHHGQNPAASRILRPLSARLTYLIDVGLGYLNLSRPARTLSGGEMQRVSLTTALGSGLVNMLYVLDEPTAGLHFLDVERLLKLVHSLRDRGNTIIAVEHDLEFLRQSDRLLELGPGAGDQGGNLLFSSPLSEILNLDISDSPTLPYLKPNPKLKSKSKSKSKLNQESQSVVISASKKRKVNQDLLLLKGCRGNNLKSIDIQIPMNTLTVIAGVSGAGKSTLLVDSLAPAVGQFLGQEVERSPEVDLISFQGRQPSESILVDSSGIGRSSRSNPATFLKIFDEIRKVFAEQPEAKSRKFNAGRFSFNNETGRCSSCEGNGFQTIEMQFLADVMIRCPDCRGSRYKAEILEILYRGKSIADVLEMTGREAWSFFRTKHQVQNRLRWLMDVGLDYLRLGQSTSTLSGGEAQRLKLALHLAKAGEAVAGQMQSGQFIMMDEPTTGLHPADIQKLVQAFDGLVDRGHTLVIVEHDLNLIRHADWVIELGPAAGHQGGHVVFSGRPEDLAGQQTPTGIALSTGI